MRRALITALVLIAAGTVTLLATGADNGPKAKTFTVELDNAFGIVPGSDFKVAGVRAGKITDMKVDRRTKKALIGVKLNKTGFAPFRTSVFCESRPQSLIGEYFIDCDPGRTGRQLKDGTKIPVTHTASTIPPDLVNNILRLPYRERLRIILAELGVATASRAEDLNEAVRRGVPALRETDRVLAILAAERSTIANLTRNADEVITALANNKGDVSRFVAEARDTARASAERRTALAGTFRRLPAFLRELRPTMTQLGRVADEQTPALRDLNASSGQLTRFFNNLGPFANASRPSFRSLGRASIIGREAAIAARPTVRQLAKFAGPAPELGKNLAIILEDLYRRDRAVEPDPRSPGGLGFNGLEAIVQYVFWQSQAVNIFDQNGYMLKVSLRDDECAAYRDVAAVKAHPDVAKKCTSALGPNQPGINRPDPTATPQGRAQAEAALRRAKNAQLALRAADESARPQAGSGAGTGPGSEGGRDSGPTIDIGRTLGNLLDNALPGGRPGVQVPGAPPLNSGRSADVLNYLLAP